jgi:hypothetical protein
VIAALGSRLDLAEQTARVDGIRHGAMNSERAALYFVRLEDMVSA